MRPSDANGHLPTDQRPFRVLIIAGSDRREYNCPGVDSKARALMLRMARLLPAEWEVDYEDLGNVFGRPRIQSCNACVSTSMALCVWPCNCYQRKDRREPDLMWNLDLYSRLDLADAWAIGPVNWYAPSSNLKLMFDRLVCMNGGNPREDLIEHKNPELAMRLEHSPQWRELSINHLEGRTAAFFCYGDGGGDELDSSGRPRILRHRDWFDPARELSDGREACASLVWQCRYGGIEVPDALWRYARIGAGKKYSAAQAEDLMDDATALVAFDAWAREFVTFVAAKGKVVAGQFRAYGYKPPRHFWQDIKLKWREYRLRLGIPPRGSSPAHQQQRHINDDSFSARKKSEGTRLRKR